ncbi:DNA-binding protein [Variovorax ginsengisoli]|uniref:DNA-binding protein n=1 Tax=Variovorax ginsengisoli TaxID=363844 RepID=A0ABT8S7B9_9BURK|nr:DNA-binding protein [Variovorax ginsengisoli]MDN8615650.1 DNA-binding protein [Variovorax ginsengisoli]MDO1534820.1 DNA-binding protein [Variovorax ginsengisoli]
MNPGTTGVSASNPSVPVRRRGPRGVQLEEVVEAADALLGRGLKPTIERVRQHLGGGSPNTISPMLDVWFERLSARVAGVTVPTEDDLPPDLRNAWNHAKHEARTLANEALLTESTALEQGRTQLSADQAEMARREEQWVATNAAIEKALTETRAASEALRSELASAQGELATLRSRYDADVDKLRESLESERLGNAALRTEREKAIQAREEVWRQERQSLAAREVAHERRFLAEIDQARQSAKQLESELAKERKRRLQGEEAAAVERKTSWAALEEAKQADRDLRDELKAQAVALSLARGQAENLGEKLAAVQLQLSNEAAVHIQTRAALAQAIAAVGQRSPSKRQLRSASQK